MATRNIQMNYYNGTNYDVLYPQSTIAQISNLQNTLNSKLNLSGGTMTGNLMLNGNPSSNLMAATKQYVDNQMDNSTRSKYTWSRWNRPEINWLERNSWTVGTASNMSPISFYMCDESEIEFTLTEIVGRVNISVSFQGTENLYYMRHLGSQTSSGTLVSNPYTPGKNKYILEYDDYHGGQPIISAIAKTTSETQLVLSSQSGRYELNCNNCLVVNNDSYFPMSFSSYVNSNSSNTYPNLGVSGNYYYIGLGNLLNRGKIEMLSYTGTGSNISLKFSSLPILIFINGIYLIDVLNQKGYNLRNTVSTGDFSVSIDSSNGEIDIGSENLNINAHTYTAIGIF